MQSTLAAMLAILLQSNFFFDRFFIAMREVIDLFAGTALQFNQVFLWHTIENYKANKILNQENH